MTNVVFPILNEPNNHKVTKLIFKKNPNAVTLCGSRSALDFYYKTFFCLLRSSVQYFGSFFRLHCKRATFKTFQFGQGQGG